MPGEGSIFRLKDGRWRAQLSLGGRSQRRFRTRTVPTRGEALTALEELKADRRAGIARSRMSTGDFLERWVDSARNIRPSTRAGYRAVVTYHLVPAIGAVRLDDLRPAHVEDLLLQLEQRLSPKSARNVLVVLRRALGQAVRSRLIAVNYAGSDFVDAPRVVLEDPDAFTPDEVRALLAAVAGDRLEALYLVAVGTGLRQGELLGLAWEDVDLVGGRLNVHRELARVDGVYRRVEPKTDRSRRTVPLSPALVSALRVHRQRVIDEGFVPTATGPVFTNRSGGPLNGSWLTHHTQAMYAAAGIRPLDFKALRATFASRLYEAGIGDHEIAQLLGHTRTHTTRRHYLAAVGRHDSAIEAIEAMVG